MNLASTNSVYLHVYYRRGRKEITGLKMTTQQVSNYEMFDPWAFLNYFKEVNVLHRHTLSLLHEFYKSYGSPPVGLKVLDFGAGPVISYEISAALYASEIVLSEYTEKNREVLQMWLDRDPKAPNWKPFFEYVVQELEGKSKEEAEMRQEELRQVVKAVIPCDITKDSPIDPAYCGPYDVVFSSLCLEAASTSLEEYTEGLIKLAKYIKPGGKLLLQCMSGPAETMFYMVGKEKFFGLSVNEEFLTTTLKKFGFCDITVKNFSRDNPGLNVPTETGNFQNVHFAIATKK